MDDNLEKVVVRTPTQDIPSREDEARARVRAAMRSGVAVLPIVLLSFLIAYATRGDSEGWLHNSAATVAYISTAVFVGNRFIALGRAWRATWRHWIK